MRNYDSSTTPKGIARGKRPPGLQLSCRLDRHYRILCSVFALFTAALLVYSQTRAFTGDEGFHLLAAQLIGSGMRPYLDFFFPQTPLNAYWNVGWMAVFGQSWRVIHAVSALLTAAATFLTADYCFRRLPVPEWRLAGAIAAGLLTGLNGVVTAYGPLAQAYGLCLLLIVAAFRVSVLAVERRGPLLAGASGFLASASAGCSLLTAPVAPVLALWSLLANRQGNRRVKFLAFCGAAILPWIPVLHFAAMAPAGCLVQPGAVSHAVPRDLLAGHHRARRGDSQLVDRFRPGSDLASAGDIRSAVFEISQRMGKVIAPGIVTLCAFLAVALAAEISAFGAHPTFSRYYLLTVPFVAILAVTGLFAIGSRVFEPERPWWPVAVVVVIAILGCAKTIFDRRDMYIWTDYEQLAKKIAKLTPPGGAIYADDHVYFVLHRKPPAGLEFVYSHKLKLPPAQAASLHICPQAEVDRQLATGMYSTVYLCEDDDYYNKLGLPKLYPHKEDVEDCALFWK